MQKVLYAILGLTLALQASAADPIIFGDWASGVGSDNTFMFAATLNDSGETFGEYCYFKTKSCGWYVLLRTACKPGTKTPVLANADATAAPLTVTCNGKMPGDQRYSSGFDDWKTLESVISDSIHIGIAIPLEADKFIVARFSLNGRTNSTRAMEVAFFSQVGSAQGQQPGTKDETL